MKNLAIYFIILALISSCKKDSGSSEHREGTFYNVSIKALIVDQELHDRLNPESPSYFGDEYVQNISLLFLEPESGRKLTFLESYFIVGGGGWFFIDNVDKIKPIESPDSRSFGYFFLPVSGYNYFQIGDPSVGYTYIRYPDGSEDEIKFEVWQEKDRYENGKIWVNGELAYSIGCVKTLEGYYFNPKFYPFSEPILNSEGKPIGSWVYWKRPHQLVIFK